MVSVNNKSIQLNSMVRPRRKMAVKIKTTDGSIYRGEYYFRQHINRIKDELDTSDEFFVAVTGVTDAQTNPIPYTFLFNFKQILYIAVNDEEYEKRFRTPQEKEEDKRILSKRKVHAIIRMVDKSGLSGSIFVRNTLNRAKDELNTKDGKYIIVVDVQEQGATAEDMKSTYFINKEYIIFVAVSEDKIPTE
jgi:hypothetical protein